MSLNVAKYHLGKVKLELIQPASMPIQLISFRQVKYELMQSAVSAFGSTWPVGRPWGVYGSLHNCCSVFCWLLRISCTALLVNHCRFLHPLLPPVLFLVRVSILQVSRFHWISFSVTVPVSGRSLGGSCFPGLPWIPPSGLWLWHSANL